MSADVLRWKQQAKLIQSSNIGQCRFCNSTTVAWAKSQRTGKRYLIEVFKDDAGHDRASHTDFHSTYCGKANIHKDRQSEILGNTEPAPEPLPAPTAEHEITVCVLCGTWTFPEGHVCEDITNRAAVRGARAGMREFFMDLSEKIANCENTIPNYPEGSDERTALEAARTVMVHRLHHEIPNLSRRRRRA